AELDQDLGNAAHADAADADEMDRTDIARQFHARIPRFSLAARLRQHAMGGICPFRGDVRNGLHRHAAGPSNLMALLPPAGPGRTAARPRRLRPGNERPGPLLRAFSARWPAYCPQPPAG